MVVPLTVDHLIALHAFGLTLGDGGSPGLRSRPQLASAAMQPYHTVFGEEAYPTLAGKAAAHAYFLAESQPFVDGNKRTAALALGVFLELNGWLLLEQHQTELADTLIALGSRQLTRVQFFAWVADRVMPAFPTSDRNR